MDQQVKKCNVCYETKPVSDFYFRKENGNYRPNCKKCKPLKSKKEIIERANAPTRICKHCGVEKPRCEYQLAGGGRWLQPYCKPCDAERKKKHRIENLDYQKEKGRVYYEQNKEVIIEKQKKYVIKNREAVRRRASQYTRNNIEKIREKGREYSRVNQKEISLKNKIKRAANSEYYKEKEKIMRDSRTPQQREAKKKYDREYKQKNKHIIDAWRKKNADKVREQKRIWSNNKAATDLTYRVKRNVRTRIRCALKPNNAYKVDTSENLLGCSIEFFRNHIESLFVEGMNWDKFMSADIEIDHIKPCAKFDLTNEDEQRQCFHYSNCQPLWWWDNNKKGAYYEERKTA